MVKIFIDRTVTWTNWEKAALLYCGNCRSWCSQQGGYRHRLQTKTVDSLTCLLAPPLAVCGSHQQQAGRAGQLHRWGLQERAVGGEAEVLLPGGPPVCRGQKQQRLPRQGEGGNAIGAAFHSRLLIIEMFSLYNSYGYVLTGVNT